MPKILLTGIRADTPIGAMAAFGLLRLNPSWLLSWEGPIAAIHTPTPLASDQVVATVTECAIARPEQRLEFSWSSTLKDTQPVQWERAVQSAETKEQCEWLAALGAPRADRFLATRFDMTAGSQKFLRELEALPKAVTPESVREALFGPWRYSDSTHSLGWDPVMLRGGAFTSVQPRELKKERGVTAAVWLASECLPLFPCFIDDRGRLAVRGWVGNQFRWPVWERPAKLAGVKALIRNPRHVQVAAIYGAVRMKAGRQPGFSPAQFVFEDRDGV
jgi:hypothetical protein